jgi:hypothetical protein
MRQEGLRVQRGKKRRTTTPDEQAIDRARDLVQSRLHRLAAKPAVGGRPDLCPDLGKALPTPLPFVERQHRASTRTRDPEHHPVTA